MAILRKKEIRGMDPREREKKMVELKLELAKEKARIFIGSAVNSPGRVRELRKTIARIKTIENEGNV